MSEVPDSDAALAALLWRFHNIASDAQPCDVILGLGSYDLRVAEHCAALIQQGVSERVVFTGASGNWTRGRWKSSEAECFAQRAIECGLSDSAILLEKRATNIAENLRFSRQLLENQALPVKSVGIVTKPNTLRRVAVCVPLHWPEVTVQFLAPPITLQDQVTKERSLTAMIHEMVGDLQRLMLYPAKGFSVPIEIPDEIRSAYRLLVERGYDEHLIQ